MKKILILALLALGMSLNGGAQLVVLEDGQTRLGNTPVGMNVSPDATLNICGISDNINANNNGGSISFGQGNNAMIGGFGDAGFLLLRAKSVFSMSVGNGVVMSYADQSKTFKFTYSITAPSFLTTSDARCKKNVSSMDGMYSRLMDINPISYNLSYPVKTDITDSIGVSAQTSTVTESVTDDRLHFGFVAQEIQNIYPNLVVEDEDGMLSIDYIGFIPVLVDAYKDLSNKVKEQEEFIADLLKMGGPSYMPASVSSVSEDRAILRQNQPNPFNSSTTVECYLPQNVSSAFLYIYDLQGKQVLKLNISDRGAVNTIVEASSLAPGMYIYTLIADGNEVDSKRMIITD